MKAMGIYRGPKKEKTMHIPNSYPKKIELILAQDEIEKERKQQKKQNFLEEGSLKSKTGSEFKIIKEDPIVRVPKNLQGRSKFLQCFIYFYQL